MLLKKYVLTVSIAIMLVGMLTAHALAVKPIQTNQGCQTEGADYLVDVLVSELGGDWFYDPANMGALLAIFEAMNLSDAAEGLFLWLIYDVQGTIVGYFGPCCFKGGAYEDPRDNGFPNDCCKPPDFSNFPEPWSVGGGDGNSCVCQRGFHPTPEGRVYGGDIMTDGIGDYVDLDGTEYYLGLPIGGEEWLAAPSSPPFPPPPP